jgi:hypothetical protein
MDEEQTILINEALLPAGQTKLLIISSPGNARDNPSEVFMHQGLI